MYKDPRNIGRLHTPLVPIRQLYSYPGRSVTYETLHGLSRPSGLRKYKVVVVQVSLFGDWSFYGVKDGLFVYKNTHLSLILCSTFFFFFSCCLCFLDQTHFIDPFKLNGTL